MSSSRRTTGRSAATDAAPAAPATTPLVVRLVEGDIVDARASVLVVNHFNDLPPTTGAAAAMDRALGGALTRRAGRRALNSRFGTTHFLPASSAPIAADAVLVVGLGDVETFNPDRLPAVGAAIVDACAAVRIRDAATILHGSGGAGGDPADSARMLVEGVLEATAALEDARLRELQIVALSRDVLDAAERGARAARCPAGVHVYFERGKAVPARGAVRDGGRGRPRVLRLGITRSGTNVKVTQITESAMDWTADIEFPTDVVRDLARRVEKDILREADDAARAEHMTSIGTQLFKCFLGDVRDDVAELLRSAPDGLVVLRLDAATVDVPWELMNADGEFFSRTCALARQFELTGTARPSEVVRRRGRPRALVVGDPTRDLPHAAQEAREVAAMLGDRGVDVTPRTDGVTFAEISTLLDAREFALLHYAGHAVYDDLEEGRGGLVFDGGVLTANDLRSRRFAPRIVVANACNSAQTGTGAPLEGGPQTRDLVAGLLSNGVSAVIGSMWQVGDAPALTFARSLYAHLLEPKRIGEAVRDARQDVIERHGIHEPAWASYVLFGAPDERLL
jgi:hypothetical protein